jgi:lipoprotein-releasing system permease protein
MHYALFIGLRYLRAKRTDAFISLITVIATAGVAIGVMTLDVVLSVMTGFEEDLRNRILGFNPHVVVTSFGGSIEGHEAVVDTVRGVPGVIVAAPFVSGQVMIAGPDRVEGGGLRGILSGQQSAIDIEKNLVAGRIEALSGRHAPAAGKDPGVRLPGIVLGRDLAGRLAVGLGDPVSVVSPVGEPTPLGLVPRLKRFVVVGLFKSGMSEYDALLAYVDLPEAQRFLRLGSAVTGVEVRVADVYRARRIGGEIAARLEFPYRVRDWMEMNQNLFAAMKLEKTVYFVVLLLIVCVAAFNIFATLVMVVMEKRKDIAILKSIGATRAGIARIFVLKGLVIGGVGAITGSLLGWMLCWALGRYEFIELPPDVFYVSTLPVKVVPAYFALVLAVSLVICFLATLYPARQAAGLVPVDVIRYE